MSMHREVLALDLESVLVPEIWPAVARELQIPELAATTRDTADYGMLMQKRIELCRAYGLTLPRLRAVVADMAPFPGARDFLAWAHDLAQVALVSDTFYELAGPLVAKLGSPLLLCNQLQIDADGYIAGCAMRPSGKAGAVAGFQQKGLRVLAAGDSFNDLEMLQAADAAFLFQPPPQVMAAGARFPILWSFRELRAAVQRWLRNGELSSVAG